MRTLIQTSPTVGGIIGMQSKLFAVCRECVTTRTSILSFPVLPPMDLETFLVSHVYNVQATRAVVQLYHLQ